MCPTGMDDRSPGGMDGRNDEDSSKHGIETHQPLSAFELDQCPPSGSPDEARVSASELARRLSTACDPPHACVLEGGAAQRSSLPTSGETGVTQGGVSVDTQGGGFFEELGHSANDLVGEAYANLVVPRHVQEDLNLLEGSLKKLAEEIDSGPAAVVPPANAGRAFSRRSSADSSLALGKEVVSGEKRRRLVGEGKNGSNYAGVQKLKRGRRMIALKNEKVDAIHHLSAGLTKREANRLAVHRHRQRRRGLVQEISEENEALRQKLSSLTEEAEELANSSGALNFEERKELEELRDMKLRIIDIVTNTPIAVALKTTP